VYGLDSTFLLLHTSHLPLVLKNSNQWAPKFPNLTSEVVENNCLPLLGCKHGLPFEVPGDVSVVLFRPDLPSVINLCATALRNCRTLNLVSLSLLLITNAFTNMISITP